MTLIDKFAALNIEQQEQFASVKDIEAFNYFVSEHGIELDDDENNAALRYFNSSKTELSDEELDTVAGGKNESNSLTAEESNWQSQAKIEGRINQLSRGSCKNKCSELYSVYAADITTGTKFGLDGYYSVATVYINCKCYKCGSWFEKLAK